MVMKRERDNLSLAVVLHLVLIFLAAFRFFERKIKGISVVNLYQCFLLAFYFIGGYFQKVEKSSLADLYYISSAILPVYYKDIFSKQALHIYMGYTYLVLAILLGLPLETAALVFTTLYFAYSCREKSISGFLITSLSLTALLLPSTYGASKEVLLSISIIAMPYNFHFFKSGNSSTRYMNLILFIIYAMLLPEQNGIIKIVMMCFLLLFSMVGARNRIFEKCWAFIVIYFLSYKTFSAQYFLPVFITYLYSFKLLRLVFHELSQIEFKKGAMEVKYSNLIFLLISLFLLSGLSYSPFSIYFAGVRDSGIYLFSLAWVILIVRDILEKKEPTHSGEQIIIQPILFFLPILLLISFGDPNIIENNFYFSSVIIIVATLITLKKKREDLFNILTFWNNKLKFYPVEKKNKVPENLFLGLVSNAPLIGASKIRFDLNLTYPVSVGLLFLGWFLVILEFLKK